MRLVTLDCREVGGRPGIILPSGEILDLAASPSGMTAAQWRPHSVVSVIAQGAEGAARIARLVAECEAASDAERTQWRTSGRLLPLAGTRLLPPIRRPGLLLMVADRQGGRSGCYVKNPNAAAGPNSSIAMPAREDAHLYLLGMVGVVLGRPLFQATQTDAARAIAALTLVADLGTRRLTSAPADGSADARQFPGACIIGPSLATLDEFLVGADWNLAIAVNGRAVAASPVTMNAGRVAALLAELSTRYAFRPGDVVGVPGAVAEFELPPASTISLALGGVLALDFSTGQ